MWPSVPRDNPPPPVGDRRAAVVTAPGRLEVRPTGAPHLASGRRVGIEEVGICGTDLKILSGEVPIDHPRILGHEAVGVVLDGDDDLPTGTRVLIDPSVACGSCLRCHDDRAHLCAAGGLLGRDLDGVFTTELSVDPGQLLPIPAGLPSEQGPLLQILGTCVHGQAQVRAGPGDLAVVVGLGVSGLLQVQLLRARGVDRVVGVTRSAGKRTLAEQLGASTAVHPDDAANLVAELSEGEGADLVVESSGALAGLRTAVEVAGHGAHVLLFGTVSASEGAFPYYALYAKELTLVSSRAARRRDYARAIEHVTHGRVALAPLLTARYPLDSAAEALARARDDRAALKVTMHVSR